MSDLAADPRARHHGAGDLDGLRRGGARGGEEEPVLHAAVADRPGPDVPAALVALERVTGPARDAGRVAAAPLQGALLLRELLVGGGEARGLPREVGLGVGDLEPRAAVRRGERDPTLAAGRLPGR